MTSSPLWRPRGSRCRVKGGRVGSVSDRRKGGRAGSVSDWRFLQSLTLLARQILEEHSPPACFCELVLTARELETISPLPNISQVLSTGSDACERRIALLRWRWPPRCWACYAALPGPGPGRTGQPRVLVADVIIQGSKNIPVEQLVARINRAGAEFNAATEGDDVRTLYDTGQFKDVRATHRQEPDRHITVYFFVQDHPNLVEEVIFQGTKHMKPEDLEKLTGIRKGGRSAPRPTRSLAGTSSRSSTTTAGRSPAAICSAAARRAIPR